MKTPTRALPPLPRLRAKNPLGKTEANPCLVIMSQMLNCWASNGEGAAACAELEVQLKQCVNKGGNKAATKQSSINYHAARLLPKIHQKK